MTWSAEGYLNWHRYERVGDRYGSVVLFAGKDGGDTVSLDEAPEGERCVLSAEVVETVPSSHIGDSVRGFRPPPEGTPVGKKFVLGEGRVFVEDGAIGVAPEDGRPTDWLDPRALYRVHEHRVRLTLEPVA